MNDSRESRAGWIRAFALMVGAALIVWGLLAWGAMPAAGQTPGVAAPSLRPYMHVFIAYAIGWGVVLLWVLAIFRRLGRVEARMRRFEDGR